MVVVLTELKMSLLENSESFFTESISKAIQAENSEEQWKFAILLLVQAIETCLKERLRLTHEVLIYSNIDKPKHTVDLSLAINRLTNISNITLNVSDISAIKTASELRNQIVHFEFNLSIKQIKSNFVKLVGFYSSFCREHLDKDMISALPSLLAQELLNLERYMDELEQRAKTRINEENISPQHVHECKFCKRNSYVLYGYVDNCYACGHYESSVWCDVCSALETESEIKNVDISSVNGFEIWQCICRDCFNKLGTENDSDVRY